MLNEALECEEDIGGLGISGDSTSEKDLDGAAEDVVIVNVESKTTAAQRLFEEGEDGDDDDEGKRRRKRAKVDTKAVVLVGDSPVARDGDEKRERSEGTGSATEGSALPVPQKTDLNSQTEGSDVKQRNKRSIEKVAGRVDEDVKGQTPRKKSKPRDISISSTPPPTTATASRKLSRPAAPATPAAKASTPTPSSSSAKSGAASTSGTSGRSTSPSISSVKNTSTATDSSVKSTAPNITKSQRSNASVSQPKAMEFVPPQRTPSPPSPPSPTSSPLLFLSDEELLADYSSEIDDAIADVQTNQAERTNINDNDVPKRDSRGGQNKGDLRSMFEDEERKDGEGNEGQVENDEDEDEGNEWDEGDEEHEEEDDSESDNDEDEGSSRTSDDDSDSDDGQDKNANTSTNTTGKSLPAVATSDTERRRANADRRYLRKKSYRRGNVELNYVGVKNLN
ncbi:hypothetical protein HK104_010166 [Borealophlyctis nickersoniae]|nr:hypothetical protein HK104_010166 [Borealophlyctis nickersoniae]